MRIKLNVHGFIATTLASAFIASPSFANEHLPKKDEANLYIELGVASLDTDQAQNEGIENSANYLRLGGEARNNRLIYGFGLSLFFYDDNAAFTQQVQSSIGVNSTAKSTASGTAIYFESGYRAFNYRKVSFDVYGGYEFMVGSSRKINDCSDCATIDINIDSGLYAMPRLQYFHDGFTFSTSYNYYFNGDVKNVAKISAGATF